MAVLSVCCVWCAEQEFKVDEITLDATHILVMKCPKCGKMTRVGFDGRTHELLILLVGLESEEHKDDAYMKKTPVPFFILVRPEWIRY